MEAIEAKDQAAPNARFVLRRSNTLAKMLKEGGGDGARRRFPATADDSQQGFAEAHAPKAKVRAGGGEECVCGSSGVAKVSGVVVGRFRTAWCVCRPFQSRVRCPLSASVA